MKILLNIIGLVPRIIPLSKNYEYDEINNFRLSSSNNDEFCEMKCAVSVLAI